jgi:uncharacterized membrane protein YtjA (UPF0391 family)
MPMRVSVWHVSTNRTEEATVLLWIAIILFVLWLLGFIALPTLGGWVHILIVLAVIALIVHLVRGRRAV